MSFFFFLLFFLRFPFSNILYRIFIYTWKLRKMKGFFPVLFICRSAQFLSLLFSFDLFFYDLLLPKQMEILFLGLIPFFFSSHFFFFYASKQILMSVLYWISLCHRLVPFHPNLRQKLYTWRNKRNLHFLFTRARAW